MSYSGKTSTQQVQPIAYRAIYLISRIILALFGSSHGVTLCFSTRIPQRMKQRITVLQYTN